MIKIISRFICTGFYSGLSPKAPGTVGTLFCAVLMWIFWHYSFSDYISLASPLNLSILCILLGLGLIPISYPVSKLEQGKKFDPQEIVIDEFAGFLIALTFLPPNNRSLLMAFIGFRIFDISKPWPIKIFEKLPGAWAVMLDDAVAGLFAGIIIYFLQPYLN